MTKKKYRKYIRDNSVVDKETNCWIWSRSIDSRGYGVAKRNQYTSRGAHRLSYSVFVNEIPQDLLVCHHCDNPKCVNPYHLFVGTNKDNMRDMVEKGRQDNGSMRGEDSWWWGRKHKESTKRKIGGANAIHQRGEGNSQYGTCWIYNLQEKINKKINKLELRSWLDEGWLPGRKMSF